MHQVWYCSSEGVKRYWADNTVGWEEWFDLDLWSGIIYLLGATHAPSLVLFQWKVKRYWADNAVGWVEWFDLDLWTCDLKINRDHLLIGHNPCTKFGIDQVKWSKDIERATHGLQTDRPTVAKQYAPFFGGGGIIKRDNITLPLYGWNTWNTPLNSKQSINTK